MPFWRDTSVASASGTLPLRTGTLGYEWDSDKDNGFARRAGATSPSTTGR